MEALLRAKAWLWAALASLVVGAIFALSAYLHPEDAWKVGLLAPIWVVFARSMSAKTSTLATITSESGEVEKVPAGRRWAAQLGMLTFALGVMSQQWNTAVAGVVYSIITAAAMWQGFRARLPFLYDRWSEGLPPAPTLTHAMVAVSLMVEVGSTLSLIVALFAGRDAMAAVYALSYTVTALIISIGMAAFLNDRGVALADILVWPAEAGRPVSSLPPALLSGVALGAALGAAALFYIAALHRIPGAAEMVIKSEQQLAAFPNLRGAYAFMAVFVAPFAEEFLFRGLLYRALDREWGGAKAIVGSAAFFAIYHPYLSWAPVAALGALDAWLYKRTGRLAPAVALHMVYNAVVVAAGYL